MSNTAEKKIRNALNAYFEKYNANPPVIVVDELTFKDFVREMEGTTSVPARGNVTYAGVSVITQNHLVVEVTTSSGDDDRYVTALRDTTREARPYFSAKASLEERIRELEAQLREAEDASIRSMHDCIKAANADIAGLVAKHERELAAEKARADTLAECFSHVVEVLSDRTRETETEH